MKSLRTLLAAVLVGNASTCLAMDSTKEEGLQYELNCALYRSKLTLLPSGALDYSWKHIEPKIRLHDEPSLEEPKYDKHRTEQDSSLWIEVQNIVYQSAGKDIQKREEKVAVHHPCNVRLQVMTGERSVSYEHRQTGGFYEESDEAGRKIVSILSEVSWRLEQD